jgi:hypothetical protein
MWICECVYVTYSTFRQRFLQQQVSKDVIAVFGKLVLLSLAAVVLK